MYYWIQRYLPSLISFCQGLWPGPREGLLVEQKELIERFNHTIAPGIDRGMSLLPRHTVETSSRELRPDLLHP